MVLIFHFAGYALLFSSFGLVLIVVRRLVVLDRRLSAALEGVRS